MCEQQQAVVKLLYDTMITAHTDQYGAPSVKMRHYLQGQAAELITRMGLRRELLAQAEDSSDTVMSAPVEAKWEEERRSRGQHRAADGQRRPVRRWREVQVLRSAMLPTDKGWR